MWLSEERGKQTTQEPVAEWGRVTVSEPTAVYLSGEKRNVGLCCPGGMTWRPKVGQEVLVLKAGSEGEQPFLLGAVCREKTGLKAGEVRIGESGACILLGDRLTLQGEIRVGKDSLDNYIRRVVGLPIVPEDDEEDEK